MATLSEYFEEEARSALGRMQRELAAPAPDVAALHRAIRAVRGAAQIAREERVRRAASALESALRAMARTAAPLSAATAERARGTVGDLFELLRRDVAELEQEERTERIVGEWASAEGSAGPPSPASAGGIEAFRRFAAREVAEIAAALDAGLQQLAGDPLDREPLRLVLRRQRALLGAARLDEVSVVAEVLRALEDLTRLIARLDVAVRQEWLDIYRVARDALRATVEPLQRNEDPPPSHPASRLRHIHSELMERYGIAPAAGPDAFPSAPATPTAPAPDDAQAEAGVLELSDAEIVGESAGEPELVPLDALVYDREGALRRALELQAVIARAVAADPAAREAADELFDLVRLALE